MKLKSIFANWPMSHAKRVTRDKRKKSRISCHCRDKETADQIFYRSYGNRQHFRLRSFASFQLFSIFGAVGLFRSDMLLIFNMVCHDSPAGQFVCPQFPYRGNDTIFWIFSFVPCHAFCRNSCPRLRGSL